MVNFFKYEFAQVAFLATASIAVSCAILSPITVAKERSYLSDAISHLIFPGIIAGYVAAYGFHLPLWSALFIGAAFTGFLGAFLSEFITKTLRIPSDSSAIISLTGFFSAGIILLSQFRDVNISAENILFGDVLAVQKKELAILYVVLFINFISILVLQKHWMAWISDNEFSIIAGYKTRWLNRLFPILLTVTILTGLFAIGSLMISFFIIFPAILTNPRKILSWNAIFVSLVCSFAGFLLSFQLNWPVGPSIVLLGFCLILFKSFIRKYRPIF